MTTKMLDHWSAPAGSGSAVACLATTFTFDPQFFTDDCLSRFLALSAVTGEGDKISSIAATFEEELRLSETAAISVLVDRGTRTDRRNLRWDLIPVSTGNGLLHAKVVILIWERHARIVVGSANLTPAGYREKIEAALAFDITQGCQIPRPVLLGIVSELRSYLELLPGAASSTTDRATDTLNRITSRIEQHSPALPTETAVHLAVAPSAPGSSPLDGYKAVWRTSKKPLRASVLSPFWDAATSTTALTSVRSLLTGQPKTARSVTAVVGLDRVGAVMAPVELASQVDRVRALAPLDAEQRTLHAKALVLENDEWVAALIGSSNATTAGWGLATTHGHRELNVWVGAPRTSPTGRALRALVSTQKSVDLNAIETVNTDDDDSNLPSRPLFFSWCTIELTSNSAQLALSFDRTEQEPDSWSVHALGLECAVDQELWRKQLQPEQLFVTVDRTAVPSFLDVGWTADGTPVSAQWVANVDDTSKLPIPAELEDLPVQLLLDALGSTRPLPAAVEHELRRIEARKLAGTDATDALRRFDSSGLLLHRTRARSAALWALRERLGTRAASLEVLRNRLFGVVGPVEIGRLLVLDQTALDGGSSGTGTAAPAETHFLLAEIALTVGTVDWKCALQSLDRAVAQSVLAEALSKIEDRQRSLNSDELESDMLEYVADAFKEARRSCGL